MFEVDPALLDSARPVLTTRPNLLWLIGSSCSGKSTVARALSQQTGVPVYDVDAHTFGLYQYDATRHPATTAWYTSGDPFTFMLSLSWPEFDGLYRAANAETFDLLAADLAQSDPQQPWIIDGGVTHPSVLLQVFPSSQIICLAADEEARAGCWDAAGERAAMHDEIVALPNGPALWQQFLRFDQLIDAQIVAESQAAHIPVLIRDRQTEVDETVARVRDYAGLLA